MASFLESVSDFLFGGVDDSAQRLAQEANARARGDILGAQTQGRADALSFIPAGQRAQAAGFQSVLDLLGQSIPAQADIFQQGNLGAQQTLLSGLPQQNAAILGTPIDLSGIQPRALEPELGFTQQSLPSIQGTDLQSLIVRALGGGGGQPFFSGGAASGGSSSGIGGSLLSLASGPVLNALGIPTPTSLLTGALGGLFGGSAPAGALASGIGGSAIAAPSLGALSGGGLTAGSGAAAGGLGGAGLASILGPAAILGAGAFLGSKVLGDKPVNLDRGNALLAQFQNAVAPGGNLAGFLQGAIGPGDVENFDIMSAGGGVTDLGQRLPPMNAFQRAQFQELRPQFITALEQKQAQVDENNRQILGGF